MKKLVTYALLGLAVASTAPALANSQNTAITRADGIVAVVNDEIILKSELNQVVNAMRRTAAAQGQNVPEAVLANQALDLLITRKLQLGIIKRAGVTTNDAVINRQLLAIAQQEGFDSLNAFAQSLESKAAGSYAALRQELIEDAAIDALWQHQLASRVKISEQEINAFLASPEGQRLNQDEYRTLHVRVPYLDSVNRLSAEQKNAAMQTAERLKQALEAGTPLETAMQTARGNYPSELQGADTGFNAASRLPRELASAITALPVGGVSNPIATEAGVDVVVLTDKRAGGAVVIPEWNTSHILAKVDSTQSPALAEQKINELYAALQRGASFDDLAATYSDDTGSATQKGGLGWVNEGQMVPEFEAMMKKTEKGDFSTPFTTQFGYHILRVNDVRQRDVTDQYRRAAAEEILMSRLAPQAQEDWIQELKAAAYIKIMNP